MTTVKLDRTDAQAVLSSMMSGNLYDPNKVDTNVTYIGTAGRKLDGTIHGTAVACLYLSMPHADGGHNCAIRAVRLANAMPKGSRVKALVAWLSAYSNIRLRYDTKSGRYVGGVLKPTDKTYRAVTKTMLADAMAKPFWSVEEKVTLPSEFTDSSLAKAVANLIAKAQADNASLSILGKAALADLEAVAKTLPVDKAGVPALAEPLADLPIG